MTIDELNTVQIGDILTHVKLNDFDLTISDAIFNGGEIVTLVTTVEDTVDDVPVKRNRFIPVVKISGFYSLRVESINRALGSNDYDLSSWKFKYKTPSRSAEVKPEDLPKKSDAVNHPSYYGGADNVYEVRKIRKALKLGFNLGNTFKYIARAGKKDKSKHLEDLEKALFYLKDEIAEVKEELNVTK